MVYDIAVVGAGVVGSLIAREMSKFNLKIALIEKENDMAMGTSKANSAIVHAGFDAEEGSLKAKLNVRGVELMKEVCKELHVPLKNIGSLVLAFDEEQMETLNTLLERGKANGVPGLEIIDSARLQEMEKNISKDAVGALLAPTASIVCPYELTIAAAENAVVNGVDFKRNCCVEAISVSDDIFTLKTNEGDIEARYVIDAAGIYADKIAAMIDDDFYKIIPRRGEYMLLDKSVGDTVSHVIFQCPTKMGKGILVTPTVDGNLLTGPTADDVEDKDNVDTTAEGMGDVQKYARLSVPNIQLRQVITSFAGLRAHCDKNDFIIEPSKKYPHFIHVSGIESPGLTASPAIAEYVKNILIEQGISTEENKEFNPVRPEPVRFREMNAEERKALVAKNPAYGRIVCRCETVTEGEILDAIHAPAGARDVDGVKRRTRAGMGRCQGGFCGSKVVELLAREMNTTIDNVTKFGAKSDIVFHKTK